MSARPPRSPVLRTAAAIVLFAGTFARPAASVPVFTGLGDLSGGAFRSEPTAVSRDGSVVVGVSTSSSGSEAFRWTRQGGMVGLGNVPSRASGVSGDGSVVVGNSSLGGFRWTSAGGMVPLGDLPGAGDPLVEYGWGHVSGISADGSTVVGTLFSPFVAYPYQEAFRWTSAGGFEVVFTNQPLWSGEALSVSADGSVLAGTRNGPAGPGLNNTAVSWTRARGLGPPGYSTDRCCSETAGGLVSADGLSVAFTAFRLGGGSAAFRWTAVGGQEALGPPGSYSSSTGISGDGSVVVGYVSSAAGSGPFIWTGSTGMRLLQDVLVNDYGADLTGWSVLRASGISADGRAIIGTGTHRPGNNPAGQFEGWVAYIPEPATALLVAFGLLGFAATSRARK